jgi:futalosine hydrolase
MRILLVAATQQEIGLLISNFGFSISDFVENESNQSTIQLTTHNSQLTVLITGVGMVATAFALGRHLAINQYELAVNLGIAGSFDRDITLGEVVEITEDSLAELGAEDGETFLPIEALGFGESIFSASKSLSAYGDFNLRQVTAITVNTVHGHEPSIKQFTDRLKPQLESMEGAAFFYACKQAGVPCLQIRAVSNYVEKRNRDAWQIGLAIKNLNSFAIEFLEKIGRNA